MASLITYVGGTGLMDKLGQIFGGGEELLANLTELRTRRDDILAKYTTLGQQAWIVNTLTLLDKRIEELMLRMDDYRVDAITTLVEIVNAAIPLPFKTLDFALPVLVQDMLNGTNSIEENTCNVNGGNIKATAVAGNTGDAQPFCTHRVDYNGLLRDIQVLPADSYVVECIEPRDRATRGIQMFRVSSGPSRDPMDPDWPGGAGIDIVIPDIDAGVEQQTAFNRYMLRNGDMEDFTGSTPTGWNVQCGVAGTDFAATGSGYTGANALRFPSTGGLAELRQLVNDTSSGGTLGQMIPRTIYLLAYAAKVNSAGGAGSVKFGTSDELWNEILTTSIGTSYQLWGTFVKTLDAPPSYIYIQCTATNDRNVDIDEVRIAPVTQLPGGPLVSVAAGATPCAVGDKWTFTTTNTWTSRFAYWMERFFELRRRNIIIPYDGSSPTIADSLIN